MFRFQPVPDAIQHQIRVVTIDGNPWFVVGDVLRALGSYLLVSGKPNVAMALKPMGEDEKGINRIETPGGMQTVRIISESGLYKLIMRSDKPEARAFQDWVTRHVLPAINRDGAYVMGEEKVLTGELSEDEAIHNGFLALQRKSERLQREVSALTQQRDELAPKAAIVEETYAEGRKNLLTVREFCRRFDGVNLIQLAGRLKDLGYLWKSLASQK